MPETITLSFALRQGDQSDATWFVLLRGRSGRVLLYLIVPSLIAFIFFHQLNFQGSEAMRLSILIWPAVVFALVGASIYWQRRRAARGDVALRDPIRYTLSLSGIDVVGHTFTGHRDWEGIQRAAETRRLYLLFMSPYNAFIIPKRAFSDDAQRRAFVALVRDRLGSRAKVRA